MKVLVITIEQEKILLDTDIGGDIDDAICLSYLLREPRCELLGITSVGGDAIRRAMVASALCTAAGRKDIPIFPGRSMPLVPIPVYPLPEGAGELENWPHQVYFEENRAVEFLRDTILSHPHQVNLLAIGNMTNIALLFQQYPQCVELLKGFYAMNGYFGSEPLPHPLYNWNSWSDPLASEIVFRTAPKVHRVFSQEITRTPTIDSSEASALFFPASRLTDCLLAFGGSWLQSSGELTMHDPLAAVGIFYPSLCTYRRGVVTVETEQEERMGATTFTPCGKGNVEITDSVSRENFYDLLFSTINGKQNL